MTARIKISVILLSLGAILAFLPLSGNYTFHGKPEALLTRAMDQSTFLTPDQVARYIVNEDSTIQLFDLRSPEEFRHVSIPGAVNIPYGNFLSSDLESYLNRGLRNIFYANDDYRANYALMIAAGLGYDHSFVMKGGLNSWYKNVMNSEYSGERITAKDNALFETRYKARKMFTELNSMPDSLKLKYRESKEIERKKLDGGCE